MPVPGRSLPVRFPAIAADVLANGMGVRVISQDTVPAITATLVVERGTSADPEGHPGLASLTGDLLDEGAGAHDAIQLAEAFARLGAQFEIEIGADATWLSVTALDRHLSQVLDLVADIVIRPRLEVADFERVRELRISRLRQLSRSTGSMADRVFVSSVFGGHPYGHGSLGTTASLSAIVPDDARAFWDASYRPRVATLLVSGPVAPGEVMRAASAAFGAWADRGAPPPVAASTVPASPAAIWLVDRPGSPQSELRVGHAGPPRTTAAYHALVTLNALLGGQFTSRINRRLREEKGITYGARTAFDFRRLAGSFSCDTSVQADATAAAVADILHEFEDVRRAGAITPDELAHAQASLTRGYVRHFETAAQLVRSAAQLVTCGLPDDTFDRFVPAVERVTPGEVGEAAERFVHPTAAAVVVVGDASACRAPLEALGLPLTMAVPEF
jgi:zinc protease